MKKLYTLNTKTAIVLYLFIDTVCAGAGMGVPIFCILLGFPVGWYIAGRNILSSENSCFLYRRIFKDSILTSFITFLLMIIIWGGTIKLFFDPAFNFQNFGHPFILYDPKVSFVGWLILMIFISPFLQLLTMIFSAYFVLMRNSDNNCD